VSVLLGSYIEKFERINSCAEWYKLSVARLHDNTTFFLVRSKAEQHIKCLFLKIPEAWEDDLPQTDLFHVARYFLKGGIFATSQESTYAGNLTLVTNLKKTHH
jgi:hypothetical protein